MPDISNSVPTELPSTRRLLRSTLIAAVIASFLLVAVVLPAEYGLDPTGIGSALGLTEMGRIKASLAREVELAESAPDKPPSMSAAAPAAAMPAPETTSSSSPAAAAPVPVSPTPRSDVATITLQPDQGREIKLSMREGARVTYSWSTDNGVVNYDKHADSTSPPREYYGYQKGTGVASDQGVLVAAFEGWHGWYWRNRGKKVVTVTLRVDGDYQDIKEPE